MTDAQMIALVRSYFAAVDAQDISAVLATLGPDCRFCVETHGVSLRGHAGISGMLNRLWASHAAVRHQDFAYLPCAPEGRIAVQFQVINTLPDGGRVHKSNCNFFTVQDGLFSAVSVYMAGENTLTSA